MNSQITALNSQIKQYEISLETMQHQLDNTKAHYESIKQDSMSVDSNGDEMKQKWQDALRCFKESETKGRDE